MVRTRVSMDSSKTQAYVGMHWFVALIGFRFYSSGGLLWIYSGVLRAIGALDTVRIPRERPCFLSEKEHSTPSS